MKKLFFLSLVSAAVLTSTVSCAQADKSKRASPPATLNYTNNDLTINMEYSQPSVKGRTIGKDIATYGQVWRTGANEATTFEVNRDVMIEGQTLPAGKYSLYTIPGEDEWTLIFNKTWKQWGTQYKEDDDALRVKVKPMKAGTTTEKMTFSAEDNTVNLLWGDAKVAFKVQ